ncbi:hypothetical protein NW070_03565 [Mycoplasmopsis cynos]|nr:hypothetical protein [Mycoplasmopsis cynos]UWV76897.1 hypothetical protein NW070_03565 [Mycoplasmopsis cynos]
MLKIYKEINEKMQLLKPAFEGEIFPELVGKKNFSITDDLVNKTSYVYFDTKHQTWFEFCNWFLSFANSHQRDYLIDIEEFSKHFEYSKLLRMFITKTIFAKAELFKKSIDKKAKFETKQIGILVKNETLEVQKLIKNLN